MHHSGKCCSKIGPVSFGLALGVVCALAVFIESLWVMHFGPNPWMMQFNIPVPTLNAAFMHALVVLVKGFIFGFFLALFYNLFRCCCPCKRCKSCHCGSATCSICSSGNKTEITK